MQFKRGVFTMAAARITGSLCRIARAIALCGALTGCATLNSMLGGDPKEREREKEEVVAAQSTASKQTVVHPSPTTIDPDEIADLQLKMTRLVARTEELEEKFSRQQERLQIIERGLTLGIVPEELQGHANDKPRAPSSKGGHSAKPSKSSKSSKSTGPVKSAKVEEIEADEEDDAEASASASASAAPDSDPAKAAGVVVADRDEFNKAFAAAHEDFRAGRFGKAIVGFSEIGKKFDPGLTSGVQQFWIARSWASLKEMQTARQLFTEFIAGHPDSPWAPRAKLELARVESALGLKETAIKRLRSVIAEHPLEDVAEMAKAEVERMSKTL